NDGDGNRDDQWYSELFNLATTTWQEASINLTALGDLGWDIDIDQTFDLENIFSIEFIIPSGTICSGYLDIDDVNLTGVLPAAPDFVGTKLVRNLDHSPTSHTDGIELYSGDAQAFVDTGLTMGQTYHYGAFAYDEVPNYSSVGPTSVLVQTLGIGSGQEKQLPLEYALEPAFPNPFNPTTTLRYALPENSHVTLTIYDIRGMVINNLLVQDQVAGWYEIQWNGETNNQMKVHSGVYFARIEAGNYSQVTKMILLK
ncbi:MAG: T9SS type A sorting domain-containing protein, partial [Candidatus Marinimicrobia bacterium]|nr:T9SS type A sorting domain-containing protein [Candidatus Neomarinimicrobiota bacterium]